MASQVKIVDLPASDKGKATGAPEATGVKDKAKPKPPTATSDRELKGRIAACFVRIAEAADARGDAELAEIIREDTEVMAGGLVSLTRPVRVLRTPILMVLGIVEPIMAFSRITRVMVERMLDRRAEKRAEVPPTP